jgi:glycosyltransferase involved in cell wall biosynthesis
MNINSHGIQLQQTQPYKIKARKGISSHDIKHGQRWGNADQVWKQLVNMGNLYQNNLYNKTNWNDIIDCWKNEPCFIVGGSYTANDFDMNKLNGFHSIGINHRVEEYSNFEWLIFLDDEFIQKTSYDISKFNGKIFAGNRVRFIDLPNVYRFLPKASNDNVDLNPNNGLYCRSLTGLCALNLALIAGANPIYLIGCDNDKEIIRDGESFHVNNYTGNLKTNTKYQKYLNANKMYSHYKNYTDRVVNVCPNGQIPHFKKIDFQELDNVLKTVENKKEKIEINRDPVICHVTKLRDMNKLNEVTRQIYNLTTGRHIQSNISDLIQPKADIYLLECLINGANEFLNFQKPKGSKVISLIHSSGKCLPAVCSDRVVTLSQAEHLRVKQNRFDSVVIPCSIDIEKFNKNIDYSKQTYGRITRFSHGKVNPRWNNIVCHIKTVYPDSQSIMISANVEAKYKSKDIHYIENISNNEMDKKVEALSNLTMFTNMHGMFIETFSLALLEGMASGLCVVLYSPVYQGAMIELIGNAGIVCNSEKDFIDTIIRLLPDAEIKKVWGLKAKNRAKEFSVNRMVESYNKLFNGVLNDNT